MTREQIIDVLRDCSFLANQVNREFNRMHEKDEYSTEDWEELMEGQRCWLTLEDNLDSILKGINNGFIKISCTGE